MHPLRRSCEKASNLHSLRPEYYLIRPKYGPQASASVTCAGMHSYAAEIFAAMEEAGAVGRAAAAPARRPAPPHVSGRHCPDHCSHRRSCCLARSIRCTSHLPLHCQVSLHTPPYAIRERNFQNSNVSIGTACLISLLQHTSEVRSDIHSAPGHHSSIYRQQLLQVHGRLQLHGLRQMR